MNLIWISRSCKKEINKTLIKTIHASSSSRSGTKSIILNSCYILPDMSKEPIPDILWMDILYPDVHVQTSLDIINRNVRFLEVIRSPAHTVRDRLITRRHPRALDLSDLLGIASFLFQLTCHVGDRLDSLLRSGVEHACRFVRVVDCRCSSDSGVVALLLWRMEALVVDSLIIGEFLMFRMLDQCGLEIGFVVMHIPLILQLPYRLFIEQMILFLV